MAFETLLLKQFPKEFENVKCVILTTDLNLLSILDDKGTLLITLLNHCSCKLLIENIKSFAWQEDNYNPKDYHLLVVNEENDIFYYSVEINYNTELPVINKKVLAKWSMLNIFQYFQDIAKSLQNVFCVEILKFEAKEAVCLFDRKVVASFFPSNETNPHIMSISDLRDDSPSYRKVLLSKELLLALNEDGTKLLIYSFANNTKLSDFGFFEGNLKKSETGSVTNFTVNLKLDLLIYITEKQLVFTVPLDIPKQPSQNTFSSANSSVTAFAKQFPSGKRLNEGLRRFSTSSNSSSSLCLNNDSESFVLKDLIALENKLFFIQDNLHQSQIGFHLLNSDQPTLYKSYRFEQPVFFIKSSCEEIPFPLLLLCGSKIFLLLYDIEQDKLVNELMIYPSSDSVETLSSLNNWINIHMDIEVLKLGLSNRQLYTVEFFLKTLYEGFRQLWSCSFSKQWMNKIEQECNLWMNVLNLVLENVYKNIADNYSCQYAEQLLQVIIGMVLQLITIIENKEISVEFFTLNDKDKLLKMFSETLLKMRTLLREFESSDEDYSDHKVSTMGSQTYSENILKQWMKWEELSPKEVIQNSILDGIVPLAQSYFSCYCKDKTNYSYNEFEIVAKDLILDYLRQEELDKTLEVLINMGLDINDRLLEIFKSTSEKDIRSLLVEELRKRNLLSMYDIDCLKFVSLLEKLYSCTSFEHARHSLEEKSELKEDIICAVAENQDSLTVGDFQSFHGDNSENEAYCRLVLDWLTVWDEDIKGRILAPLYLTHSNSWESILKTDGFGEANKMSLWCYLLENGNLPYLMNWIDIWLGIHPQNTDSFAVFDKLPLTKEMIDVILERAPLYVSETILNILAKNGIFCEEEQENISLFLSRVGKAQCDINDLALFSCEKATLTFSELCHRLVHYFLKHNLLHLLYAFIEKNYKKFTVWPSCPLCEVPLFDLSVAFYKWSENHNDALLAHDVFAETARYLFNLPDISPIDLLLKVPIPLAVSILLFKPESLKDSINSVMQNSKETVECLKKSFEKYPLLYNYLFKTGEERFVPDVTVYELLKDNTLFDTCQLFGWQSANSLKSEDSQTELPHFSLQSLSEQYGLKKELTYLYYLMEGRPNYSYLKFIAQEVILETGLSLSRVRSACRDVTEYALSNYKSPDICASCITFIELLGQDSLSLRASLIGTNMLHNSRISEDDDDSLKCFPDIGRKFKQAYLEKTYAVALVSELENTILSRWDPFSSDSDALFRDIVLWMPLMTLSHLYEIEAGHTYLTECAKQNKWLHFLVFAQVFQVPKEQVLKAASKFSNSCISYHIFHALHRKSSLLYDVAYETKTVPAMKTQNKDMRKSLYTRIGVIKGTSAVDAKKPSEPEEDKMSVTSDETSSSSDVDLRSYVLKDLFSQLLLAHGSDAPWDCLLHTSYEIQNPVLSVLAASYPESPLEICFFIWLFTSLSHSETVQKQLEILFPDVRVTDCNTDDLENLIVIAIQNHKILTLWQGVHIFLHTTPLTSLMGFLRSFMVYKRFDSSIETFQNKLWEYPKNSEKSSVIQSLFWIENISITILKEAVIGCSSNYERQIMLRHFADTRLEKSFSKDMTVPEFIKVYHMRQCLGDDVPDIEVKHLFLPENDTLYKASCWEAVKKLLQCHLYENAQLFSDHAKLPQDQMLMLQINQETEEARQNQSWENLSYRIYFWKNILLKLEVLSLHTAVDFLEVQCELSNMYGEKYFLMKSVVDIVKENTLKGLADGNIYNLDVLNRKMWGLCVKADVQHELLPEIFDVKPVLELKVQESLFTIKISTNECSIEDEKERTALCSIIGRYLSKRDLNNAFQLASEFSYKCLDLEIIKACYHLAKGDIDNYSIDNVLMESVDEVSSTRIIDSLILWVAYNNEFTSLQKTTVELITNLSRKSEIGVKICHQILVQYIVSTILKESFVDIIKEKNMFSTLKKILILELNDGLLVAKSLIAVQELEDKEVAKFLSEEIWNSLKILRNSDLVMIPEEKSAFSDQVIYDPLKANASFQLIVKLCQDPSVLGTALMSIYSIESAELSSKSSDISFTVLVDLCICAHECFTAACNMDGISHILHSAQNLVNMLEEAEKFSLMVHLLTGLDRYSEMMYVFDVLKFHDKFNLLFEKKMDNVPNLRLALLDYLKKYPPSENDNYFYTLANRFGMYREKAEILEMSVQKQLSQLCKRNSALDHEMKDELENALQTLSEAAESYCMAECLHQAQNCTRLAQLIALQIYFIPNGVWIIGLDTTSVARFITDHDKFSQAYIVAEEYGNHHLWSQALLHNVVIRGDEKYLAEFQNHFGLSTSLISDVVKRYKKLPNKSENTIRCMKLLLSKCTNVRMKYSLAQELGFSDIISELMMGEGSSYLQDLIENNIIK